MKKKFGQNFLNNQAIIDEIITSANITADSMIYEVGPGDGALSREIVKINPKKYLAVEIDKGLIQKLEGVFVQIGLVPNSGFIKGLVETNKYGEILVSEKNRTNIDKIYAAGDVTNVPYKQIIIAMGEGAKVGLTAFEDLMIA